MSQSRFGSPSVSLVRADCDEYEAAAALMEVGASLTEKDDKLRAVVFMPRKNVPGTLRGPDLSRTVAGLRQMPEPGESCEPEIEGEEIFALIVPERFRQGHSEIVASTAHDDDCPRLAPKAKICSCECDAVTTVFADEACSCGVCVGGVN